MSGAWRMGIAAALVCLLVGLVRAGRPGQAREAAVRRVGPGLYEVGAVRVDTRARTIRCRGRVNMQEGGPIELLACLATGKTHESVFVLELCPAELQTALLLLGLEEGRNPSVEYGPDDPEGRELAGGEVSLAVEWQVPDDSALNRCRAEQFLYNVQADTPADAVRWVFLGSSWAEGRFAADIEGSLISTYHDPWAILELVHPTANDDVFYVVNEDVCPPVGTPVELVVQAGAGQ